MVLLDPATNDVQVVLDGRKFRGRGWPVHACNLLMLEKVGHHLGSMGGGVVLLKHCLLSDGLQDGDDVGPQDLVSVPETSQTALDVLERGSAMQVESSPCHY